MSIVEAHINGTLARVVAIDDGDEERDRRLIAQGNLRLFLMDSIELMALAVKFTPSGENGMTTYGDMVAAKREAIRTRDTWIGDIGGR